MTEPEKTLQWAIKIGARLRDRRKALGLSLEDLSRLSGSTAPTLSHIERGTRDVKLSTLASLAAALRIDLADLFISTPHETESRSSKSGVSGYNLDED